MKKIKLYLEYGCYPMWIYDEQDELVDNAIVPELIHHTSIVQALDQIQVLYDRLFKDNNISFEFEGFTEQQDKEDFLKLVSETTFLIENQLKNDYKIENKIMI